MKLNISPDWLLRMAEKEGNGIISVGGLVTRLEAEADAQAHLDVRPSGGEEQSMTTFCLLLAAFSGALVGAFLGAFLLGCLVVARDADRRMGEWEKR